MIVAIIMVNCLNFLWNKIHKSVEKCLFGVQLHAYYIAILTHANCSEYQMLLSADINTV